MITAEKARELVKANTKSVEQRVKEKVARILEDIEMLSCKGLSEDSQIVASDIIDIVEKEIAALGFKTQIVSRFISISW